MTDDEFNSRLFRMIKEGELMFVFDVNADGELDGEPMDGKLTDDFVEMGLGRNRPCVLRYPDGDLSIGNKIEFTPAGVEWLKREQAEGRF